MKILGTIGFLILFALPSIGQIRPMDHLFKDKHNEYSPYLTVGLQFTQLWYDPTFNGEIGTGVIINKTILIGYDYSKSFLNIFLPSSQQDGQIEMTKNALHLEYTLWPKQKIHLSLPIEIGVGHLGIKGIAANNITGNKDFNFIEPGVFLEENIWKYAKIGIGAKYRSAFNVDYCGLTSSDISRFTAVIYVKFGKFKYPKH
jgi:hypothetical protein